MILTNYDNFAGNLSTMKTTADTGDKTMKEKDEYVENEQLRQYCNENPNSDYTKQTM
jgi:hypothetical protein